MTRTVEVKCLECKAPKEVRLADLARGWGKYCSKACKAKHQTKKTGVSGPNYRAVGRNVEQMRNGSYAKSQFKGRRGGGIIKGKTCCECPNPATHATASISSNGGLHPWSNKHGSHIAITCDVHHDNSHPFEDMSDYG